MNRLLILLIFLLSHPLYGQKTHTIEPCLMECVYDHFVQMDTLTPDLLLKDLMILRIGERTSQFFSHYKQQDDSIEYSPNCEKLRKELYFKRFGNLDSTHRAGTTTTYEYIYKHNPKGKCITYSSLGTGKRGKYVSIVEDIPDIEWTITDSTKTIHDYCCRKARADFRGRTYIAWFTQEIPIKNGPWKLGGLPGLILEAYDEDKHYHYVIKELKTKRLLPVTFYNFGDFTYEDTRREVYLQERYKRISAFPIIFQNTDRGRDLQERDYH